MMSKLELAQRRVEFAKAALRDAALTASYAVEHEQECKREYRNAYVECEKLQLSRVLNYEI